MIRLSITNYVPPATLTASSALAAYPVSNLRLLADLGQPWITAALGAQWAVINYGAARSIERWAILETNYTSVRIQAHTSDAWTAPAYDSGLLTIGTNIGNGRLCRSFIPAAAVNFPFNRILIPSQATTDGASGYRTGAVTAGPLATPPRDVSWAPRIGQVEATRDVFTVSRRRQRSYLGPALFHMQGSRLVASKSSLMRSDLAAWFALERQWKAQDVAVVSFIDSDVYHVHVMRSLAAIEWTEDLPARSDYEFEEVA